MARRLELKTVPLDAPDGDTVTYAELLVTVLRKPSSPAGMNYEEMGRRIELIDKIKAADGTLLLEDAEWKEACAAFQAFAWANAFGGIVACGRDLLAAPEVEIEETKRAEGH